MGTQKNTSTERKDRVKARRQQPRSAEGRRKKGRRGFFHRGKWGRGLTDEKGWGGGQNEVGRSRKHFR